LEQAWNQSKGDQRASYDYRRHEVARLHRNTIIPPFMMADGPEEKTAARETEIRFKGSAHQARQMMNRPRLKLTLMLAPSLQRRI
jgi:hypothetical protein